MASPIPQNATEAPSTPDEDTKDVNRIPGRIAFTEESDVVPEKRSPRRLIDKTAYAELQRSLSPANVNKNLESLKEKYESCDTRIEYKDKPRLERSPAIKLDNTDAQILRNKSKLPVARPRTAGSSQLTRTKDKSKFRHSFNLDRNSKKRDENANELFRKSSSSSVEFISVVTRSDSEGSIDKFTKELNMFTMEKKPKEKKRSNSFRKIFSGKIFSKDKKKKEDDNKFQYKENAAYNDNVQNESNPFARSSPHRHTTGSSIPRPTKIRDGERSISEMNHRDIEKQYAQMHVKEFNHIKQNFDKQPADNNEKPINNPGPIDYKKLPAIQKFIDTSSSASTLELPRDSDTLNRFDRFGDSRNTPPRAQELRQDVRLVNPKALIPINSERPLPNPYQNLPRQRDSPNIQKHNQFNFVEDSRVDRPYLEETYGTVLDSLEQKGNLPQRPSSAIFSQKPPRSPSLESTKIRLPTNREITPLSPRMQSPIPQHHVSTEKIIATELLKSSRSPTPTRRKPGTSQLSPSHQKLDIGIDYPDNINGNRSETRGNVTAKPPIARVPDRVFFQNNLQSPVSQATSSIPRAYGQTNQQSPYFDNSTAQASPLQGPDRILTNAMVHTNNTRAPTPNTLLHNRSLSPLALSTTNMSPMQSLSTRSNTPVDIRASPSTNKSQSPQKEDMKRSVEAYYWKEIKKLKDQENQELYYYQMQMMPFGYAEDPIRIRRARSSSPSSSRNSRRSLSLPRDPKPQLQTNPNETYGMFKSPPIPEERAVMHHPDTVYYQQNHPDSVYYQQNFKRNTPERRTVGSVSNGTNTYSNTVYRPIFKRGSLTTPVREFIDDQQKKVSFNNSQKDQAWPTKNGYTQSPPQRRIEVERNSLEDDVFLPNKSTHVLDGAEVYGYANRPFDNHNQYVSRQQLVQYPQNARLQYPHEPTRTSGLVVPPQAVYYGAPRGLVRHGSIQLQEPVYGQRLPRRMSLDNRGTQGRAPLQNPPPRRQIFMNDDVYGNFGGYHPQNPNNFMYASRQSIVESVYGYNQNSPRHGNINNRVCDIYGQIHDKDDPSHMKRSGVILGQLQTSPQGGRHATPLQAQDNFVRNSRLTASANDMHRRYQNMDPKYASDVVYRQYAENQHDGAPSRPLPPVPTDKKVITRRNIESVMNSDNQRNCSVGKSKKRGIFGKHQASNNCLLSIILEETKHLGMLELERLVISEKLKLLRTEKISENSQMIDARIDDNEGRLFSNQSDIEILRLTELRRMVLLEELQLIRMKIKRIEESATGMPK